MSRSWCHGTRAPRRYSSLDLVFLSLAINSVYPRTHRPPVLGSASLCPSIVPLRPPSQLDGQHGRLFCIRKEKVRYYRWADTDEVGMAAYEHARFISKIQLGWPLDFGIY